MKNKAKWNVHEMMWIHFAAIALHWDALLNEKCLWALSNRIELKTETGIAVVYYILDGMRWLIRFEWICIQFICTFSL